jgi:hypothetical protein
MRRLNFWRKGTGMPPKSAKDEKVEETEPTADAESEPTECEEKCEEPKESKYL